MILNTKIYETDFDAWIAIREKFQKYTDKDIEKEQSYYKCFGIFVSVLVTAIFNAVFIIFFYMGTQPGLDDFLTKHDKEKKSSASAQFRTFFVITMMILFVLYKIIKIKFCTEAPDKQPVR